MSHTQPFSVALVAAIALSTTPTAWAQTCATTLASVASGGVQGNGQSQSPSISSDGRYVAFYSLASNLVPMDMNGARDVFVHNRTTGQTTRVSVTSSGKEGNNESRWPSISSDDLYVAFESNADNLVPGDTNGTWDVFVHDRTTGQIARMSVDSGGGQGNNESYRPSISSDGRYVAFESSASNLVPGDANGAWDVFVHDRTTGQTTLVSVSSSGGRGDGDSRSPSISSDGRHVAFWSSAGNLVQGDTNSAVDVFFHDRMTGQTARVSITSGGDQGNDDSYKPSVSSDGRYTAFYSWASNLVPGDTNTCFDSFVHDRMTGQTARISVDSSGGQGIDNSWEPSISSDGGYVAFWSLASNLVPGDTNGWPDVFVRDWRCPVGAPYCFGDGGGTPCPCANPGASGEGCANSSGAGGQLSGVGSASVTADDLILDAKQLLAGQAALLFAGFDAINGGNGIPFGDGLRCTGGGVVRLGTTTPDAGGSASFGPGLGASGGWAAGDVRRLQVWYRDPVGSPCGTGFNLTNGVELTFQP